MHAQILEADRTTEPSFPRGIDLQAFFPDDGVIGRRPPAVQLSLPTFHAALADIGLVVARDKTEEAPSCA